jgi:hypothetical protein
VGSGLAEVLILAALTIIVLPCGFFTLLALLDRFERSLDPDVQIAPTPLVRPVRVAAVGGAAAFDDDTAGAAVLSLPIIATVVDAPAAATG